MITPPDSQTRSRARASLGRLLAASHGKRLPDIRRRWLSLGGLLRAAIGAFGVLAVLAAAGFGALTLRLAQGPISIERLNPQIAASLRQRFGSRFTFALGPGVFERSEQGLGFALQGVSIRDAAGRTVLAAPKARFGLDALALLGLRVQVKRLDLDSVELRLRVLEDGTLEIAGSSAPDAAPLSLPAPPSPDAAFGAAQLGLLASMAAQALAGDAQTLDHIQISHGRLEVENVKSRSKATYEKLNLNFDRAGGVGEAGAVATGPSGPFSIVAHAQASGELALEAHGLSLDEFRVFRNGDGFLRSDAPLSAKFAAKTDAAGKLLSMAGVFSLGAGALAFGDDASEPMRFDEVTGQFAWQPQEGRYQFGALQLLAGQTRWSGAGWAAPPAPGGANWSLDFHTDEWTLAPERPSEKALKVDVATLQARYFVAERRFALDNLVFIGAGLDANANGTTILSGAGPTAKMTLNVAHSSVAALRRVWPRMLRPDIRQWCMQRVQAGEVVAGSLSFDWDAAQFAAALHGGAVPAESLRGEMSGRDALVEFLPGLPPLAVPEMSGSMTGRAVKFAAKHGTLELSAARRIQASDIAFTIPDTSPPKLVPAKAEAHVQGSADALADIFSRDAMKSFAALSLDPATVKGQFDAALEVNLLLGDAARPEDAKFRAEGTLANLQIEKFLGPERLEQGALTFSQDSNAFKAKGEGKILGAPATIELSKAGKEEGAALVSFVVDNALRLKRGWNFGPSISGPESVKIKAPLSRKSAEVEIDLTKLAIDNPIPGFVKPAGQPGKASFSVKGDADGIHIANLAIDAGAASARGSVELDDEGAFVGAKLSQARLSPGDDLKVDVANGESGAKITVRGATLDARPMAKALVAHGLSAGAGANFDLDMKVAAATGANRQSLRAFELTATNRNGAIVQLSAKGTLGAGAVTVQRQGNGETRLRAGDAGALVKFFDIYSHMEGGGLELEMKDAESGQTGVANVKDFALRDEPAMRQLVAAGQSKAASGGAVIDANFVRFEKLTTRFTRTPGRIELQDAAIFNSDMGLTTQGFIDYSQNRIDLNGTFVPAYQLNNLLTHVPILGLLLGGGPHEGVFGLNYRIAGPASGPVLSINPLSAIAPGFLRKIFGALDGTIPQSQPSPTASPRP